MNEPLVSAGVYLASGGYAFGSFTANELGHSAAKLIIRDAQRRGTRCHYFPNGTTVETCPSTPLYSIFRKVR